MAVKAYLLIETGVGDVRRVIGDLADLSGVQMAAQVTGPYDIIATVTCLVLESPRFVDSLGDQVTHHPIAVGMRPLA